MVGWNPMLSALRGSVISVSAPGNDFTLQYSLVEINTMECSHDSLANVKLTNYILK